MQSAAKHLAWGSNHGVRNDASEMLRCALHDDRFLSFPDSGTALTCLKSKTDGLTGEVCRPAAAQTFVGYLLASLL
jgi:hypothetical protein